MLVVTNKSYHALYSERILPNMVDGDLYRIDNHDRPLSSASRKSWEAPAYMAAICTTNCGREIQSACIYGSDKLLKPTLSILEDGIMIQVYYNI